MSYNNYLLSLANISNEIGYSLTYGYGDIAANEINFLKTLITKSEEIIPVLETEACMAEVEELDREDRSFNYWMTMLYGKEDVISPMDSHSSNKANRLNRRKQNKKNKSRDRIHGRRHSGAHGGVDFRYIDSNPFCNKHRYEDAMFVTNGKHHFNSAKKASAMSAREQEYYSASYSVPVPFYELNTDEDFHLDYAYRTWMEEQAEKEREEKYRFNDYGFPDYDYDFYDPYDDIW